MGLLGCKELIRFMAEHGFEVVDVADASFSEDLTQLREFLPVTRISARLRSWFHDTDEER